MKKFWDFIEFLLSLILILILGPICIAIIAVPILLVVATAPIWLPLTAAGAAIWTEFK